MSVFNSKNNLPEGIWDNPTPEEFPAFLEFVIAWNSTDQEVEQWYLTLKENGDTVRQLAYYTSTIGGGVLVDGAVRDLAYYISTTDGGILVDGKPSNNTVSTQVIGGGVLGGSAATNNEIYTSTIGGGVKSDSITLNNEIYTSAIGGGVLGASDATNSGVYAPAVSGGIFTNGVVGDQEIYASTIGGGVSTSGKAIDHEVTTFVIVNGGASTGGTVASNLICGDTTSGGVLIDDTALYDTIYTSLVGEGVSANGTVVDIEIYASWIGGGLQLSGTSDETFVPFLDAGGGVEIGGTTAHVIVSATTIGGGVEVGTTATDGILAPIEINGGLLANCESHTFATYVPIPNGGSLALPNANTIEISNVATAGGVKTSPTSSNSSIFNGDAQGGISVIGHVNFIVNEAMLGGTAIAGVADAAIRYFVVPSGGTTCDPTSDTTEIYNLATTGGAKANLTTTCVQIYNPESSGGSLIAAYANFKIDVVIFGGVGVEGVASIAAVYNVSATRGLVGGTIGENTQVSNIMIGGGVRGNSNASTVKQSSNPSTLGGVQVIGFVQFLANEAMAGGGEVNGLLDTQATYNISTSRGIMGGTTGGAFASYNPPSRASVFNSGSAHYGLIELDLSSLASILLSGVAVSQVVAKQVTVGGGKISGSAEVCYTGNISVIGGIKTGGLVTHTEIFAQPVSGGVNVINNVVFLANETMKGGILGNGTALIIDICNPAINGGVRTNGSPDTLFTYNVIPLGGARCNGTLSLYKFYEYLVIGDVLIGVGASTKVVYRPAPSGGVLTATTAVIDFTYNPTARGGLKANNTASVSAEYNLPTLGGLIVAGMALRTENFWMLGGSTLSGNSTAILVWNPSLGGGIKAEGLTSNTEYVLERTYGGCTIDGELIQTVITNHEGFGGGRTNGAAVVAITVPTSGGVVVWGKLNRWITTTRIVRIVIVNSAISGITTTPEPVGVPSLSEPGGESLIVQSSDWKTMTVPDVERPSPTTPLPGTSVILVRYKTYTTSNVDVVLSPTTQSANEPEEQTIEIRKFVPGIPDVEQVDKPRPSTVVPGRSTILIRK